MRERRWHAISAEESLKALGTGAEGISTAEAKRRLGIYGPNRLEEAKKVSTLEIFLEQFRDFLVIILILAAVVSAALGVLENEAEYYLDAGIIAVIVVANGLFGFFQNYKAEKSLEELKRMAVVHARVLRDGKVEELNASELVPGDILILEEGMKIPADARIVESKNLRVDEAILTGESVPVEKGPGVVGAYAPLPEKRCMLYADTFVASGHSRAAVTATGMRTEVGKIAEAMVKVKPKPTLFQMEMEELGKKMGLGILLIIAIVALVHFLLHVADPITIFLTAIVLAVAAIPEGLPAVVTFSLALGTRRMARKNSLARKLSVIESLSSVDVICTDKTGTLTESVLTVKELYFDGRRIEVTGLGFEPTGHFLENGKMVNPNEFSRLLLAGLFCNNAVEGRIEGLARYLGDPTEIALLVSAKKGGFRGEGYERVDEAPFSSERKRMITIHRSARGGMAAYMKGAPEVVLEKCAYVLEGGRERRLTKAKRKEILEANTSMAAGALRVLGFAYRKLAQKPKDAEGAEEEMVFIGLQGMYDPPRKEVADAIAACKTAGIRVMMITGDNITTAKAVAKEIGIDGEAIEGTELEGMSEHRLRDVVEKVNIFARVSPLEKQRISSALQMNGHNVAMTGDGVNDAPALKDAHVGIAMGVRGTDIAKQASDMVILDDNFATIVEAVKEGRTIFANLRNFVTYLLMSNFSEVFVVFVAAIFGFLPLGAAQLLWINLLTDGFPAIVLGADPPRKDIMKRKPRPKKEGVINAKVAHSIVGIGILDTVLLLGIFFYVLPASGPVVASTMVFTGFVLSEFVRLVIIRRADNLPLFSNKWLIIAVLFSLFLQLLVLYGPLAPFFDAVPLGVGDWGVLLAFMGVGLVAAVVGYPLLRGKEEY